jgi:CBS domain-containing protein
MTTQHEAKNSTIEARIAALNAARDDARLNSHLFSVETWHSWRDLEQQIATKLEDVQHRLARDGSRALEVAAARTEELIKALDQLLHSNSHQAAHTIMSPNVRTCSPGDSLACAASIMWEGDCGVVPVVDEEGKVVGMITDRDICMAAYFGDRPLSTSVVGDSMSRAVHRCSPHDTVQRVAEIMSQHQIRRVPVTAPDGTLLGIISVADLARNMNALPSEHPARGQLLPTLGAVSTRRADPTQSG